MNRFTSPMMIGLFLCPTVSNPVRGQSLVFDQSPMTELPVLNQRYFGHDELSTALQLPILAPIDLYQGTFMADDFAVKSPAPINRVQWWGSYLANQRTGGVQSFFVAFEEDVPVGATTPFSHPGKYLGGEIVTRTVGQPAAGQFSEAQIHPGGGTTPEALYEYNTELTVPFNPTPNTVYWLKVVALEPPSLQIPPVVEQPWGWHNRDYSKQDTLAPTAPAVTPGEFVDFASPIPEIPLVWHFQDDAVSGEFRLTDLLVPNHGRFTVEQTQMGPRNYVAGEDGPEFIAQHSKDLAFRLYSVPEPSTAILACFAAAGLFALSRRPKAAH